MTPPIGCAYPLCPSAHRPPRSPPAATHVSICLIVASSCSPKIFVLASISRKTIGRGDRPQSPGRFGEPPLPSADCNLLSERSPRDDFPPLHIRARSRR